MSIDTLEYGIETHFKPVDVVLAHGDEWAKRRIGIYPVLNALENMVERPLMDIEERDIIQVMNDRIIGRPAREGEIKWQQQ